MKRQRSSFLVVSYTFPHFRMKRGGNNKETGCLIQLAYCTKVNHAIRVTTNLFLQCAYTQIVWEKVSESHVSIEVVSDTEITHLPTISVASIQAIPLGLHPPVTTVARCLDLIDWHEGSATAHLGVQDFKIHWISRGFRISEWISGFQSGFLDFKLDFWISSGFPDFNVDFWILFEPLLFWTYS